MHSQMLDVGLEKRQARPGPQSPPHMGGLVPGWIAHILVVVVVLDVAVVVVVTRIFSTGTQSIFG